MSLSQQTVSDGKSFPRFKQYRAVFPLPASRKVMATDRLHHHRGKQECVQRTSHVESPDLWKSRLFILWDAFCNLVVPTSNKSLPGADLQGCKTSKISKTRFGTSFIKTVTIRNRMVIYSDPIKSTFSNVDPKFWRNCERPPQPCLEKFEACPFTADTQVCVCVHVLWRQRSKSESRRCVQDGVISSP